MLNRRTMPLKQLVAMRAVVAGERTWRGVAPARAIENILQEFAALQTNSLVLRRSAHQAFQVDLEMLKRVDFLCAAPLASLQDLQHK
jgi:hypothetical protein